MNNKKEKIRYKLMITARNTRKRYIAQLSKSLDEQQERENRLKPQCKEYQEDITQLSESLNEQQQDSSIAVEELTRRLEAAKIIYAEEVAQSEELLCKVQFALDDATSKQLNEKQSLMDQITLLQENIKSYNDKNLNN